MLDRFEKHLNGSDVVSSRSSRSSVTSSTVSSSTSSSSSSSSAGAPNPKGTFRFTTNAYTGAESAGNITITVVRTGGNEGTVSLDYATGTGTAVVGTDYQAAHGTLTFGSKETNKSFQVPVINNPLAQGNKTVKIMLSNITNGGTLGSPNAAILTILDNQTSSDSSASSTSSSSSSANPAGTLGFNAAGYTVNEAGNSFTVTVTRAEGSTGTVTVPYGTSNGTAVAGTDYQSTSGTLTFAAGETTKTFQVSVIDNFTINGNHTFNLILGVPTGGATLRADVGTVVVTIFDNDDPNIVYGSGALKFSRDTYNTTKGSGTMAVTVQRTGGASGTVSVNYATSNGSATSGTDFVYTSGTLVFLPGESSKLILIPIIKTTKSVDNGITFNVNLSGQTSPATLISPSTTLVTIGN